MITTTKLQKLTETRITPASTQMQPDGTQCVTFPRAAFGTLLFKIQPTPDDRLLTVHLGEKRDEAGRLDRSPPGTIRYLRIEQTIPAEATTCRIVIPPDKRNTGPAAIKMPPDIGEVFPFRYAEIENATTIQLEQIRQIAVWYPFDDEASAFQSSSDVLNAIWDICKYTIKATTFCGVYVDGDRERIPYEGDAYINQLGHYGVDHEYNFARYSHEYMLQHPTWPTEWHLHSVMMAWMDYLYSGETESLNTFYDILKAKTLLDFARADGLISVDPSVRTPAMQARLAPHFASGIIKPDIRDVVDWPPGSFTDGGTGERDNHEICPINTVANAFHAHALHLMAAIAAALGNTQDQNFFATRAAQATASINKLLFDPTRGIYIDGENSQHASLHSNMFMLAFDLVPNDRKPTVVTFIKSRGMACSVYGAQHLLEALYMNQEAEHALALLTAQHDRSWWNMIQSGSTMTLEAWDLRYKNNLDWNHAWGAAPANIIPRYLLGVRPLAPGFTRTLIQPQPAMLTHLDAKIPTILGPINIAIDHKPGKHLKIDVDIPPNMYANVEILNEYLYGTQHMQWNGQKAPAQQTPGGLMLENIGPGSHTIIAGH